MFDQKRKKKKKPQLPATHTHIHTYTLNTSAGVMSSRRPNVWPSYIFFFFFFFFFYILLSRSDLTTSCLCTKPVIESTSPPKCHGVTMETHPAIIMSRERAGELRGDAAGHQCLLMMTPGSVSLSQQMCQTGRDDVILILLNANKIIRSYLTEPLGL